MNNTARLCLSTLAAILGLGLLGACSKSEEDPNPVLSIAQLDTDASFMAAMMHGDVSTREAPKPNARFVLSQSYDSSGKHYSQRTVVIIDSATGCAFQVDYKPVAKPSPEPGNPPDAPLGAPYGPPALAKGAAVENLSIKTRGESCVRAAQRADLARARDIVSKTRSGDTGMPLRRAFASGLDELRLAIEQGGKPAAGSRFALTEQSKPATKDAEVLYTFLERSTGCQWRAKGVAGGPLAPDSIEPAKCLDAYAPSSALAIPEGPAPAASAPIKAGKNPAEPA